MGDWEKQKRVILPYLQRAEEIDKLDDKVAYYSRLYAVDQGINLDNRHPKADELLSVVLTQLERNKPSAELNHEEDKKHCERFALNVFRKAQKKDVQGVVNRDTAKAYYAAFNFLEILKQFGDLAAEVERLRRFAVYRASEIKKAIDEGREPPPIDRMQQDENESADSKALIQFDPGYQVGLRVLCTEDGTTAGVSGIIQSTSGKVGALFNVELASGKVLELSTSFLAPDLPKGSRVTFYSPDGLQYEGEVTEMNKESWPPVYTLQLENATTVTTTHSNFTLTYVPIVCESPGSWLIRTESQKGRTLSQDTNGSTPAPPQAFPGLGPNDSFIVPPSLEPANTGDFGALPLPDATPPEPVNVGRGDTVEMGVTSPTKSAAEAPPPQQNGHADRVDVLAGLVPPEQPPEPSPEVAPPPQPPVDAQPQSPPVPQAAPPAMQYHVQSPVHMVVPQEAAPQQVQLPPQPTLMLKRPPNFEPDLQGIEDAKRCAKYANTSLNFNDVDNAIVYLTDALKILTGQVDS